MNVYSGEITNKLFEHEIFGVSLIMSTYIIQYESIKEAFSENKIMQADRDLFFSDGGSHSSKLIVSNKCKWV